MDPFVGEIRTVGFNYAPAGWAFCDGSLVAISSNQALFALLGTQYGGNGTTNFALPNLQKKVAVGGKVNLGETAGSSSVTLLTANLPAHNHLMNVSTNNADNVNPGGAILAVTNDGNGRGATQYPTYTQTAATAQLANNAISNAGQSQPVNVQNPYLVVNYIIALQGIFPPRS